MQTSQAPQPTHIHPAPPQGQQGPPPQQQIMPAAPPNPGPAPGQIPMQHAQYAPPQQGHQQQHVQGTTYPPQQQQQAPQHPQQHHHQPPPQQQQQHQQPMYPQHQGLNGGWQSDQDYNERRKMIAKMYVGLFDFRTIVLLVSFFTNVFAKFFLFLKRPFVEAAKAKRSARLVEEASANGQAIRRVVVSLGEII
jgi:hypothetical protein